LGNREAFVEVLEFDVGGGNCGDQAGLHRVAPVFGLQQSGAGRLVAAADAAPKIEFPAQKGG
jgi:hypothetical protein